MPLEVLNKHFKVDTHFNGFGSHRFLNTTNNREGKEVQSARDGVE